MDLKQFSKAVDVIPTHQKAVVVFTKGDKFSVDHLGIGETGNWKTNPDKLNKVDKVIIYLRKPGDSVNYIFLGNFKSVRKSNESGRYVIAFSHLSEVGTTNSNWFEFGRSGQNPLIYLNLES